MNFLFRIFWNNKVLCAIALQLWFREFHEGSPRKWSIGIEWNTWTHGQSFENVVKFKCLEATVTNQNYILKKLWVDQIQVMLATVLFRVSLSAVFCLTTMQNHCMGLKCGTNGWTWRVYKNRILWRIFGPRREEVAEEWRRLHNKKLHNLHALPIYGWSNQGGWHGQGM